MTPLELTALSEASDLKIERATGPAYFVAWSEFGTRYRLLALPLATFDSSVRDEVGAAPTAVVVTLWGGKSAIFNAGGTSPLVDAYIGEKLGIQGEDLLAVGRKLRPLLVRGGG